MINYTNLFLEFVDVWDVDEIVNAVKKDQGVKKHINLVEKDFFGNSGHRILNQDERDIWAVHFPNYLETIGIGWPNPNAVVIPISEDIVQRSNEGIRQLESQ